MIKKQSHIDTRLPLTCARRQKKARKVNQVTSLVFKHREKQKLNINA